MSNNDYISKKNAVERVFASAVRKFLSKMSSRKANYKNPSVSSSALPLECTRPQPFPPCSPSEKANDCQDATKSDYEGDPIFSPLDASDLPDLTLSLSSVTFDAPNHSDSPKPGDNLASAEVAIAKSFAQNFQTEDHFKAHVVTQVTPRKVETSCEAFATASATSCRLTSPPPTPSWSFPSSTSPYAQCASSLTFSPGKLLSPSPPSSPNQQDLQPCEIPYAQVNTSSGYQIQYLRLKSEEQQKEGDGLQQAADSKDRIPAIDPEGRSEREELETKRFGSLSVSLFSTSPSTCSHAPSEVSSTNPPLTTLSTPKSRARRHQQSPVLNVYPNANLQFSTPDTPAASNRSRYPNIPSTRLSPGFNNLGVRPESNRTDHEERSISKLKTKGVNKLAREVDNPGVEFATVLASPPPTSGLNSFPAHNDERRTFESSKLIADANGDPSSGSDPSPVSPFTISACGRSSPLIANPRRPPFPFFPDSRTTPPPTPPSSVQLPSPGSQQMQHSVAAGFSHTSVNNVASNVVRPMCECCEHCLVDGRVHLSPSIELQQKDRIQRDT